MTDESFTLIDPDSPVQSDGASDIILHMQAVWQDRTGEPWPDTNAVQSVPLELGEAVIFAWAAHGEDHAPGKVYHFEIRRPEGEGQESDSREKLDLLFGTWLNAEQPEGDRARWMVEHWSRGEWETALAAEADELTG